MVRYKTTIRSKHPAGEVFDYLSRFSSAEAWDPSIVSGEMLTPEPVQVGSRFKLVTKLLGREVTLTYETVALERPRRFVVRADGGSFVSEDTVTVEPADDGGSVVIYDATLRFSGLGKLLTPLWAVVFRRIGSKAAFGLQDWLNRERLAKAR